MRLPSTTFPLLTGLAALTMVTASASASASSSPSLPSTAEVLYWPVDAPEPSILAQVSYDPISLTSEIVSYHPPPTTTPEIQPDSTTSGDRDLVRVGLYSATAANPKQWVGSVTSLSALAEGTVRLHLGPGNEIYHVSLSVSSSEAEPSAGPAAPVKEKGVPAGSSPGLRVQLVPSETAPRPHLNRPIAVGPDGKGAEEVVEKSLWQKYWWVLAIITFVVMTAGKEEGQGR